MRETLHLPKKKAAPVEPIIRLAMPADVDRMVAYGEQFWHQTRYFKAGVDYDLATVTNFTHHLLDEGVVMYAEDGDGEIVALMLIVVSPFPMNWNHLAACEWVFYVDPNYRRGGLGAKLIQQAEKILKERSVKFFTMVSLTNVTPEAAQKLYEALGFEQSEINFTKDLTWQP